MNCLICKHNPNKIRLGICCAARYKRDRYNETMCLNWEPKGESNMKKMVYSGNTKCIKGDILVFTDGGKSVMTLQEKRKLEKVWDILRQKRKINMKAVREYYELESYEIMNHLFGTKETKMSNKSLQAQLKQARIDRGKIDQEVDRLEKEIEAEDEPKLGDIVVLKNNGVARRVCLLGEDGKLEAYWKKSCPKLGILEQSCEPLSSYKKTGENIIDLARIDN